MLSLNDRFKLLEADLLAKPPAFVMSRQLPFAIFRYDPNHPEEREWKVRKEVDLLATRVANHLHKPVAPLSLAELFWQSIRESESVEALIDLEKGHGFAAAERQVNAYLSDPDFRTLCSLLLDRVAALPKDTAVLFLVHATVFAPGAYRISSLLEQLSGQLRMPTILFYPGTWDNSLNYMGLRTEDQTLGSYRVKIYGRES
jgi:BREX protein BrxB